MYVGSREIMFDVGEVDGWGKVPMTLAYQGPSDEVVMPNLATMERLVVDYLGGGYEEVQRIEGLVSFRVNGGASDERVLAFYGAACAHIHLKKDR